MADSNVTEPNGIFERAMKALMEVNPMEARFERTDRGSVRYNTNADMVRAVLTAIREPSEGQLEAAGDVMVSARQGWEATASNWYTAMIDALLEEGR